VSFPIFVVDIYYGCEYFPFFMRKGIGLLFGVAGGLLCASVCASTRSFPVVIQTELVRTFQGGRIEVPVEEAIRDTGAPVYINNPSDSLNFRWVNLKAAQIEFMMRLNRRENPQWWVDSLDLPKDRPPGISGEFPPKLVVSYANSFRLSVVGQRIVKFEVAVRIPHLSLSSRGSLIVSQETYYLPIDALTTFVKRSDWMWFPSSDWLFAFNVGGVQLVSSCHEYEGEAYCYLYNDETDFANRLRSTIPVYRADPRFIQQVARKSSPVIWEPENELRRAGKSAASEALRKILIPVGEISDREGAIERQAVEVIREFHSKSPMSAIDLMYPMLYSRCAEKLLLPRMVYGGDE
jgi:hypothetical protein